MYFQNLTSLRGISLAKWMRINYSLILVNWQIPAIILRRMSLYSRQNTSGNVLIYYSCYDLMKRTVRVTEISLIEASPLNSSRSIIKIMECALITSKREIVSMRECTGHINCNAPVLGTLTASFDRWKKWSGRKCPKYSTRAPHLIRNPSEIYAFIRREAARAASDSRHHLEAIEGPLKLPMHRGNLLPRVPNRAINLAPWWQKASEERRKIPVRIRNFGRVNKAINFPLFHFGQFYDTMSPK